MAICPNCGHRSSDQPILCPSCGMALGAAREIGDVRKTVTVLFSDVTGSTSMGERLDPEALQHVLSRYFDEMRTIIERHGGTVEKFIGDAVMAVFGIPEEHEDDALRAVRAAAEMRERLASLNEALMSQHGLAIAARIGLNTGLVITGRSTDGQRLATGDVVNIAARLESSAEPGEILIGQPTYALVRDAVSAEAIGPLLLKGKADPVAAWRLVDASPDALGIARHFDTPFIGRHEEMRALDDVFRRIQDQRVCELILLLGEPGIGKSRVIQEFLAGLRYDAEVLAGHCLPYGESITYWPVIEMLTAAARLTPSDEPGATRRKLTELLGSAMDADVVAERLAHIVGVPDADIAVGEMPWAFRRLLESLGRDRPLIVVFEDLHWAEPALLDLIELVAELAREASIMLIGAARPDLLDQRPGWHRSNVASILLEPLSDRDSVALIDSLVGQRNLSNELRERVLDAADGVPLFVEEMVEMLTDTGALVVEGELGTSLQSPGRVEIPTSITSLIEARLDHLPEGELALAEYGSIEGRSFHFGAVAALSTPNDRIDMAHDLMGLLRRDLVRPDRPAFVGQDAFRFRHQLIRDVAYERIPKTARADLHARFADWLIATSEGGLEYDEIIGHHLEQAVRWRASLGTLASTSSSLAERASERLASAGRRALDRSDVVSAAALLKRAIDLLPQDAPGRADILLDRAEALLEIGDLYAERRSLDEALRLSDRCGDAGGHARAEIGLALLRERLEIEPVPRTLDDQMEIATRIVNSLSEGSDDRALAAAYALLANVHYHRGAVEDAAEATERAIGLAAAAGDRRLELGCIGRRAAQIAQGMTPAPDALSELERLSGRAGNHLLVRARIDVQRGYLLAMLGRAEESRAAFARAFGTMEELGSTLRAYAGAMFEGMAELILDDPSRAEVALRKGRAGVARLGERSFLSTIDGFLAYALSLQAKDREAERFCQAAEVNTRLDDFISAMLWRMALARVRTHQGRLDEAEALARDAVMVYTRFEHPWSVSQSIVPAHETLAYVLACKGDSVGATASLNQALAYCRAKGDRMSEQRVQRELAGSTNPPIVAPMPSPSSAPP